MKHTIPALALATLAVAASAQTAAPAGLSYNRIGFTRSSQKNVASQNILSVSSFLGSSNFLASIQSSNSPSYSGGTSLGLGYVFKNVAFGVDATVGASSGVEWQNQGTAYSVNLRRALNEVVNGLEISLGYSYQATDASTPDNRILSYELAYNINKQYSVAYGIQDIRKGVNPTTSSAAKAHNISVRYSF